MKSEWKEVRFGDIIIDGTRNGIYKSKEYHGEGLKIVNMGELFAYPRLFAVPMQRVRITDKEREKTVLLPGDLLFARRSLVAEGAGKCSIIMSVDEDTTFESSIIRARPNKEYVDSLFLFYYFSSPIGRRAIKSITREMAVSGITGKDLLNLSLRIPSLSIQRSIAAMFSCLDYKIDQNNKINANLEAQAQAIFKSWFVDFEPFRKGEFVDSELGPIPQGWQVGTLSDIANITMGQSPSGSSYNETGKGVVFFQGRAEFGWRFPTIRLYTSEPKRMAKEGDVLVSVRAPVGDMNIANEDCCIGRGLAAVRSKCNAQAFIFYLLKHSKRLLDNYNGEGTVFGAINKRAFNNLKILIPSENCIEKYEEVCTSFNTKIKILTDENRILAALRDALLPKLMSGEIEVPAEEQ